MLDLAALVCSQAIRKNANYAAIHNTAGLIQVEQQDINGAVREFQTAAKLDPTFFEAQMNFAAVNLSFRGFKASEDAYKAALKIRPNDYDAHLGLAQAAKTVFLGAGIQRCRVHWDCNEITCSSGLHCRMMRYACRRRGPWSARPAVRGVAAVSQRASAAVGAGDGGAAAGAWRGAGRRPGGRGQRGWARPAGSWPVSPPTPACGMCSAGMTPSRPAW